MSGKDSRTPGARSSQEVDDLNLQQAVAGLMKLSTDDLGDLSSYTVSTCDAKIHELVTYINNPTGEKRTISEVLGQLTLLYHHKAQLQATEHIEQLMVLQTSYQAEQQINSHLRDEFCNIKEELSQIRQENESIRQENKSIRQENNSIRQESRELRSQLLTVINSMGGEQISSPGQRVTDHEPSGSSSDPDAAPACKRTETSSSQARMKTFRQKLDDIQRTAEDIAPTGLRPVSKDRTDPGAMSDLISLDHYPPSVVRHRDMDTLYPRGAPKSVSHHYATPLEPRKISSTKNGHLSCPSDGDRYLEPPSVGGSYLGRNTRSHHDQIHSPAWKGGSCPSYRDLREQHHSDDSDDAGPYREQGLRTRQLESLARDIERFDPSNRESTIEDYLREVERCLLDLPHASAREKLR